MKRDSPIPMDITELQILAEQEVMSAVYTNKTPVVPTQQSSIASIYPHRRPNMRSLAPHSLVAVEAIGTGRNFSLTPSGLKIHTKPSFRRYNGNVKTSRAPVQKNRQLLQQLRKSSKNLLSVIEAPKKTPRIVASVPPQIAENVTIIGNYSIDPFQQIENQPVVFQSMGVVPPPIPQSLINTNIRKEDLEPSEREMKRLILVSPSAMRSRSQIVKQERLLQVAIKKAQWFRKNPRKSEVRNSEIIKSSARKKKEEVLKSGNSQKATVKLPDIKREFNPAEMMEKEEEEVEGKEENEEKQGKYSTVDYLKKAAIEILPTKPLPSRHAYIRRKKPTEFRKSLDKHRAFPRVKGSSEARRQLLEEDQRRVSLDQESYAAAHGFKNKKLNDSLDVWENADRLLLSPPAVNKKKGNKENIRPTLWNKGENRLLSIDKGLLVTSVIPSPKRYL